MLNINSKIEEIIRESIIDFESIVRVTIRSSFAEIVTLLFILFIIKLIKDFY